MKNRITKSSIKRLIRKVTRFTVILIVGILLFLGAWCLPPKMVEKVLESLKPKSTVEDVLQDETEE